jgi:hypothetical protein
LYHGQIHVVGDKVSDAVQKGVGLPAFGFGSGTR